MTIDELKTFIKESNQDGKKNHLIDQINYWENRYELIHGETNS